MWRAVVYRVGRGLSSPRVCSSPELAVELGFPLVVAITEPRVMAAMELR